MNTQNGFSKIATIVIVTAVVLVSWWYWGQKTSPTANWQTYRNEEWGFEVSFPSKEVIKEDAFSSGESFQVFIGSIVIYASRYPFVDYSSDWYLDTPPNGQITMGGITWKTFFLPKGYCDGPGPGCSPPIFAIQARNGNNLYSVKLGNKQEINDIQDQILSTFKFLK